MGAWLRKAKIPTIVMGIAFVLLALFFVTATTRLQYEAAINEEKFNLFTIINIGDVIGDVGTNISLAFGEARDLYFGQIKFLVVVVVILLIMMIYKSSSESEYKDIEHGSGDWAKDGEEYSVLSKKEGMILAEKHYLPVIPTPPQAKNGNILVIGGSGSGKSASFAIPNALQMLGSYIFTDPKGELYDRTAGIYKKYG